MSLVSQFDEAQCAVVEFGNARYSDESAAMRPHRLGCKFRWYRVKRVRTPFSSDMDEKGVLLSPLPLGEGWVKV